MIRDSAMGDGFLAWKAWTAKIAFRRALFRAQIADMSGKRVDLPKTAAGRNRPPARVPSRAGAVKRAAAAEMIAQEARAARLKALLDAAREQATVQTIESAEKRFAEAKGAWEAAQKPLIPDAAGAGSDDEAVPGTAIVVPMSDARSVRQVVLRSTAIAGLFLAGAVVYFDPDFGNEGLMGDTPGVDAAPVSASADVYTDIDPLVSVSRPSVTAADAVRQAEDAVVETPAAGAPVVARRSSGDGGRTQPAAGARAVARRSSGDGGRTQPAAGEAADVRKMGALEGNPVPVRRAARRRVAESASPALTIAPTPARNPFHVGPDPSAVRDAPVLLRDYE